MSASTSTLTSSPSQSITMRLIFLASSLLASTAKVAKEESQSASLDFGIFAWIHHSEGGFYNPKQEFRQDEKTGIAGVFAKERIEKNEVLVTVPWDRTLKSDGPEEEVQMMCCGTVAALAREMRLGDESKFAPYVNYLNSQDDDQLPSAWTPAGQELLRTIVGGEVEEPEIPPAEPTEWLSFDCDGKSLDALSAKAAVLVVQRSEDFIMIPAYDMYNHRNGKWFNTRTDTEDDVNHVTKAKRVIEAGEQIHVSYNQCEECGGRDVGYGTGGEYQYNFLERMPGMSLHYILICI
jgi:hypothetical protein